MRSAFWLSLLVPVVALGAEHTPKPAAPARQEPVCDQIAKMSSDNPVQADFLSAVRHKYPSCASWLARACTSPLRFAPKTAPSDASPTPTPTSSPSLVPSAIDPTTFQSQAVTSCGVPKTVPAPDPVNTKLSALVNCLPTADDRFPLPDYRRKIADNAQKYWNLINDKRLQDLKTVLALYDREGIPHAFAIRDTASSIHTLRDRVEKAATRADSEAKDWQTFIADQITDAGEDDTTTWTDKDGNEHNDVERGYYSYLKSLGSDQERFDLLADRASKTDDGDKFDGDGHLTPYHAKMLLIYNLENKLREKYKDDPDKSEAILDSLGSHLNLKTDVSRGGRTEWKWVIPHDGFMLGATPHQMRNLFDESANPETQRGFGTGIDCATFAQHILVASGYDAAQEGKMGRLTSLGISHLGKLNGLAVVDRMSTTVAQTLQPGDLIVHREKGDDIGHVQIVAGYDGDPPGLVVISAEGGYQRGIIRRVVNVFPKAPQSCTGKYEYNSDPSTFFFRALISKEPE